MQTDRNRLLCEWLGIPAKRTYWIMLDGVKVRDCQSELAAQRRLEGYRRNDYAKDGKWERASVEPEDVYPALATREGFWVLWDALVSKGYVLDVWSRSDTSPPIFAEIDQEPFGDAAVYKQAATPHEALFAAAWALREREKEGTHAD